MAWEPVIPQNNVIYLSVGNNLTLSLRQTDGECEAAADVMFIQSFGSGYHIVAGAKSITSIEELIALVAGLTKQEQNHVENV